MGLTFCSFNCFSLYPKAIYLRECIESQLNMRHPKLVQWFKMVELPRIAGLFIPLFKKWSMEYAGRSVYWIICQYMLIYLNSMAVPKNNSETWELILWIILKITNNWENSKYKISQWCCRDHSGHKLLHCSEKVGFRAYFLSFILFINWRCISRAHELVI